MISFSVIDDPQRRMRGMHFWIPLLFALEPH